MTSIKNVFKSSFQLLAQQTDSGKMIFIAFNFGRNVFTKIDLLLHRYIRLLFFFSVSLLVGGFTQFIWFLPLTSCFTQNF